MIRSRFVLLSLLVFFILSWTAVSAASMGQEAQGEILAPPFFLRSWGAEGDMIRNPAAIALTDGPTIFVSNTSLNRITRITTAEHSFFNWGEFGTGPGQFTWPAGIAVDGQKNVYVVDSGMPGRIQKFDRDGRFITSWNTGLDGVDLGQLQDIDVDPDGNVYVTETPSNIVLVFDANGRIIRYWGNYGEDDVEFSRPLGIAVDKEYVYVVDSDDARIYKFDLGGRYIRSWGGYGEEEGQFKKPWRIAVDSKGDVYVTDIDTNYVYKFDSDGNFLERLGVPGEPGEPDEFDLPRGIEVDRSVKGLDSKGNKIYRDDVFVADRTRVIRLPDGKIWGRDPEDFYHAARGIYAGSDGRVYATDRGPAGEEAGLIGEEAVEGHVSAFNRMGVLQNKWPGSDAEQLKRPDGISGDSEGNLYVADPGTRRIVKYDSQGHEILGWDKKEDEEREFYYPLDVAVSPLDQVFVADTLNYRIEKFDSEGNYLDDWVTPRNVMNAQIPPPEIRGPTSVAVDDDYVYVFNLGVMRVQKFDLSGEIVAEWGDLGSAEGQFGKVPEFTSDDLKELKLALIHVAPRLALYNDYLLATDPGNHRVQVFDKDGTYLTQWGVAGSGAGKFTRELDVAAASNGEIYVADMAGHRIHVFSFERPSTSGQVINGSFENDPALTGWHYSQESERTLPSSREEAGLTGTYALLLGEFTTPENASTINTSAGAHQTIYVDPQIERPSLSFSYNMQVNDNLYWVDFLAVIEDAVGVNRLATIVQDGYRPCFPVDPGPMTPVGWRTVHYDLSQYSGQTIRLAFYNRYLHPGSRGIWTYVDDVRTYSGADRPAELEGGASFMPVVAGEVCDEVDIYATMARATP